jgi:hypothetical protein
MRNALVISLTLLTVAIPVHADQPAASPRSTTQFGSRRPSQNPYAKLFEVRDALTQAQQQVAQSPPKKTIVCGMTIIEADPFFDQKMKVTPPGDPEVRYTIRAVEPSICK